MNKKEKEAREEKLNFLLEQLEYSKCDKTGQSEDIFKTAFRLGWNLSHRYSRDVNR